MVRRCLGFGFTQPAELNLMCLLIFRHWNKMSQKVSPTIFKRKHWRNQKMSKCKWMLFCLLTFGRLQMDYVWITHFGLGFTAMTAAWKGFQPSWKGHEGKPAQTRHWGRRSLRGEHMTNTHTANEPNRRGGLGTISSGEHLNYVMQFTINYNWHISFIPHWLGLVQEVK